MANPPRALRPDTRVVPSIANGLVLIVATSLALRRRLDSGVMHAIRAVALYGSVMALAVRQLPRHHPFPRFGAANQVTTMRAALVCFVASLLGEEASPAALIVAAGLSTLATLLDGVDGWLARRSGMSSAFGARFDMETDALLVLVLSLLVWHADKAGAWVILAGLLRYLFIAAGRALAWMRRPLPPSRRRQTVCVVQIAGLVVALLPQVTPPPSVWIAGGTLAVLLWSFALDTFWLWSHR
jgi:phosphatidylglycerophosphate synthase